jgi:hypothetical protein
MTANRLKICDSLYCKRLYRYKAMIKNCLKLEQNAIKCIMQTAFIENDGNKPRCSRSNKRCVSVCPYLHEAKLKLCSSVGCLPPSPITFNIILPSTPRFPNKCLLFSFPTTIFYSLPISQCVLHVPPISSYILPDSSYIFALLACNRTSKWRAFGISVQNVTCLVQNS